MPKTSEEIYEMEQEISNLEYTIRYLTEENEALREDVLYWKERYFEYYEQDQL